jgi:HSP20 family molecular chaperone IbpA
MMFDQTWLAELLDLQRKTAEFTQGKKSVDEVQDLVMTVLNKWGINDLPWDGDFKSRGSFSPKGNEESKTEGYMNINISETKQHVIIKILIPGIADPNDLTVKLVNNVIYISGKNSILGNEEGSFSRKIRLPALVTTVCAEAIYRDNHLTITLPKMLTQGDEVIPLSFFPSQS